MRYEAYLREGTIQPHAGGRVFDEYDELPNAYTFAVYIDGQLASSFRLHVTSPQHRDLPAAQVFRDLISPEVQAGKIMIDPTRFVAQSALARKFPELPYVTVRLGYMAAEFFGADAVLATVRAEHQAFYKRVFGHKAICEPRPYPSLTKPISLMMLQFPPAREHIAERYPFFRSSFFERRMLFERPAALAQRSAA